MAEPKARVLVCCVELCSLHIQASQSNGSPVADALFADGAAACIIGHQEGSTAPILRRSASILLPGSQEAMGWTIGNAGFSMVLSPAVPDILACAVRPWVQGVLAEEELTIPNIQSWAIHPGGPRVLESVADALGLPEAATEASATVLREHGNMSSATILFILERLLSTNITTPALVLAFGPGLTGEMMLLG